MSLRVGEFGKTIRIDAEVNMSASTNLKLTFKKPDGTTLVKQTVDGVTAPPVDYVDPTLGTFLASEYWSYTFASGDVDQEGVWSCWGEYIEGVTKSWCGDPVQFTVLPCGV